MGAVTAGQLLILLPSPNASLLFLVLPEVGPIDDSLLPADLMLGFANLRDWRDTTKPEQQEGT